MSWSLLSPQPHLSPPPLYHLPEFSGMFLLSPLVMLWHTLFHLPGLSSHPLAHSRENSVPHPPPGGLLGLSAPHALATPHWLLFLLSSHRANNLPQSLSYNDLFSLKNDKNTEKYKKSYVLPFYTHMLISIGLVDLFLSYSTANSYMAVILTHVFNLTQALDASHTIAANT